MSVVNLPPLPDASTLRTMLDRLALSLDESQVARARAVRAIILDVDGVLTDGSLYYDQQAEALKRFHVFDGLAIKLLQQVGIGVAVISARDSPPAAARLRELGVTEVQLGAHDKGSALDQLLARTQWDAASCAYIGDDIIDLPILQRVGWACAPATAHPLIRPYVHYWTQAKGGQGAIREVVDLVFAAQGLWPQVLARYHAQ